MSNISPSQPGYAFRSADIIDPAASNTGVTREVLRQIVQTTEVAQGAPDPSGLLAAQLLQSMSNPSSERFNVYPFNIFNGNRQQILPANPLRKSLYVQFNIIAYSAQNNPVDITNGDYSLYVLFEESTPDAQFVEPALRTSTIARGYQLFAKRSTTSGVVPQNYPTNFQINNSVKFSPAPTNAISLLPVAINGEISVALRGVVIEGV